MEKPILFKGDMVRAILDGRKTQTRRVIKNVPDGYHPELFRERVLKTSAWCNIEDENPHMTPVHDKVMFQCPYGKVGDKLWVRETWSKDACEDMHFRADCLGTHTELGYKIIWKSPIHLKKIHARLWLEVTGVRVERVRDISGPDIVAEGIKHCTDLSKMESDSCRFLVLWESMHGLTNYAWRENPWVWVVEFKRIEP